MSLLGRTVLVAYMAALYIGALQDPVRPSWLDGPHRQILGAFQRFTLLPGVPVFGRSATPFKEYSNCVAVFGRREKGPPVPLYRSPCPAPTFQLYLDTLDRYMHRVVRVSHPEELGQTEPGKLFAPRTRFQVLQSVGEFYCHSELVEERPFSHVLLFRQRQFIHYETGDIVAPTPFVCRWACDAEPVGRAFCSYGEQVDLTLPGFPLPATSRPAR